MIRSMTGYGSAKGEAAGLALGVEIKSVNNRYLDVSVKLPRSLLFAEEPVKAAVGRHISRGKVDVFITVDASASDSMEVRVNEALLRGYIAALTKLRDEYGLADDMSVMNLCRLPDVLSTERRELDADELLAGLMAAVEEALAGYDAMREREGEKLRDDVLGRLDEISRLTGIVEERAPQTVAEYRARLEQKLYETLAGLPVDDARVLTECAPLRRPDCRRRGDRAPQEPHLAAARHGLRRLAHRPQDGLPHPGAQPREQYDRLQVPERRHSPRRRRPQGRDREDTRADTERGVSYGAY